MTKKPSTDTASTQPQPGDLHPDTQRWFDDVDSKYVLEEHHTRLLLLAGRLWDRGEAAHQRLTTEGLTVESRQGIKPHPCIAIEREARIGFQKLIKQLALDDVDEPKRGVGRPPGGLGVTWRQLNGEPEPRPGKRAYR